ncbi:hypothetical protein Taro_030389, partial [Colocasia esculenta]|nr:hypothetical protein [Colocasia esculenta]
THYLLRRTGVVGDTPLEETVGSDSERGETNALSTSTTDSRYVYFDLYDLRGLTPSPPLPPAVVHADDETSHHEGRIVMMNHRFTKHSDWLRAKSAWTTIARANFKHLLYNV